MRSSFVQRLKNPKYQTAKTRESDENSYSNSKNHKTVTFQNPKKQITQHCQDIKSLLLILGNNRNPQKQTQRRKFQQNVKNKGKVNFIQNTKISSDKKDILSQFERITSRQRIKTHKIDDHQKISKFQDSIFLSFQRKDVQNNESHLFQSESMKSNFKEAKLYSFPNKRKENKNFFTEQKNVEQNQLKQQNVSSKSKKDAFLMETIQNEKVGLQNIGNTCYINSVLQCLFHLPEFNTYFMNEKYLSESKQIAQKFNSDQSIIQKYHELYHYITQVGRSNQREQKKSAFSLKLALSKNCSLFLDWQQQDAHEFLRKLLEAIHQEINRGEKSSPYRLLKTKTNLNYTSISALADEYSLYYKLKDDSYIYDSFGGQIYNNIKCVNCMNQSISFENCLDISLPLVKGKNKLNDLLNDYFGDEKLTDYYKCQFCGQTNKNSTKTVKLWKTPEILIIQLKRSQFGKKNQQPISFPVDLLSLQDFINNQNKKVCQKYANYTLKSVVCHRGAVDGGHYWALIKQQGKWHEIDDQKVRKLPNQQIKTQFQITGSSQAYLLFYQSMNR